MSVGERHALSLYCRTQTTRISAQLTSYRRRSTYRLVPADKKNQLGSSGPRRTRTHIKSTGREVASQRPLERLVQISEDLKIGKISAYGGVST